MQASRSRKPRSPNRGVPVNDIIYRRLSIVEDKSGILYILKGVVTRVPGVKALRPTDVPAIMLTPHAGARLLSMSEWSPSAGEVLLRTSTIGREIHDISLTSAGVYTRGQQKHAFSLYGSKGNQDDEDASSDGQESVTFDDDDDDGQNDDDEDAWQNDEDEE
jgi:hypothetical protein